MNDDEFIKKLSWAKKYGMGDKPIYGLSPDESDIIKHKYNLKILISINNGVFRYTGSKMINNIKHYMLSGRSNILDGRSDISDAFSEEDIKFIISNKAIIIGIKIIDDKVICNDEEDYILCDYDIGKIRSNTALRFEVIDKLDINKIKLKSELLGYRVIKLTNKIIAIVNNDETIVMSDKLIGFASCNGLFIYSKFKEIVFKNVDTSNINSFGNMFSMCQTNKIIIDGINASNVKTMERMFDGCKCNSLKIRNIDTSNCIKFSNMFAMSSIYLLNLSEISINSAKEMNDMFYKCRASIIDINGFKYRRDIDVKGMFNKCNAKVIGDKDNNFQINAKC